MQKEVSRITMLRTLLENNVFIKIRYKNFFFGIEYPEQHPSQHLLSKREYTTTFILSDKFKAELFEYINKRLDSIAGLFCKTMIENINNKIQLLSYNTQTRKDILTKALEGINNKIRNELGYMLFPQNKDDSYFKMFITDYFEYEDYYYFLINKEFKNLKNLEDNEIYESWVEQRILSMYCDYIKTELQNIDKPQQPNKKLTFKDLFNPPYNTDEKINDLKTILKTHGYIDINHRWVGNTGCKNELATLYFVFNDKLIVLKTNLKKTPAIRTLYTEFGTKPTEHELRNLTRDTGITETYEEFERIFKNWIKTAEKE